MGVDAEGDVGCCVPELAGDEDDILSLRDQERGEGMPEVVEAKLWPVRTRKVCVPDAFLESATDNVPEVQRPPGR